MIHSGWSFLTARDRELQLFVGHLLRVIIPRKGFPSKMDPRYHGLGTLGAAFCSGRIRPLQRSAQRTFCTRRYTHERTSLNSFGLGLKVYCSLTRLIAIKKSSPRGPAIRFRHTPCSIQSLFPERSGYFGHAGPATSKRQSCCATSDCPSLNEDSQVCSLGETCRFIQLSAI